MRQTRKCEMPDCSREVPMGILMCARHWRMVPRTEQREVYRTYRGLLRGEGREPYEKAVAAAVHAVGVANG